MAVDHRSKKGETLSELRSRRRFDSNFRRRLALRTGFYKVIEKNLNVIESQQMTDEEEKRMKKCKNLHYRI